MIPWTNFDANGYPSWCSDPQADLHDYWLMLIDKGPSMAHFVLNSPMLELAHERRFVITQQGGVCAEFESEHTRRISETLEQLDQHFNHHAGNYDCNPASPHKDDLVCLWSPTPSLDSMPPLELPPQGRPPAHSIYRRSKSRSPTADSPYSPDGPSSVIALPSSIDAEEGEPSEDTDDVSLRAVLDYPRASHVSAHGVRANKNVRQRKGNSGRIGSLLAEGHASKSYHKVVKAGSGSTRHPPSIPRSKIPLLDILNSVDEEQVSSTLSTDQRPGILPRIVEEIEDPSVPSDKGADYSDGAAKHRSAEIIQGSHDVAKSSTHEGVEFGTT